MFSENPHKVLAAETYFLNFWYEPWIRGILKLKYKILTDYSTKEQFNRFFFIHLMAFSGKL